MKVIRQPGLVYLTRSEWELLLPLLNALGYVWENCSGGGKLWEPNKKRCVGEYRHAGPHDTTDEVFIVEAEYLVDVLPSLLGVVA